MYQNWETSAEQVGGRTVLVRKPSIPVKRLPKFSEDEDEEEEEESSSSTNNEATLADLVPPATNEKVILNVGGQVHETFLATLSRLPDTRLAKLALEYESDEAYDPETGTFFFNRNPAIFLSILQYYRTGELHIDFTTCGNAIKNELDYWQIDANDIEPCCWAQYAKFLENKETLKMLDDSFAIYEDEFAEPDNDHGCSRLQRRLWRHIEDPSYSVVGKIFASLSVFFVILSIVAYVLETHTYFRVPRFFPPEDVNITDIDQLLINGTFENVTRFDIRQHNDTDLGDNPDFFELTENNSQSVWYLSCIALTCFAWFLFEYIVRLSVCPNKKMFFTSMLNNFDLLVLLAMCIETLTIVLVDIIPRNRYLRVLIPLRFARIIRIMKLMKHYRPFKVLVYTIKVSIKELVLMIIFLMIGVVIFACLVYYVEPQTFYSIPIGCWWALVTMTTVGYGDYTPKSVGGFIIACFAAIFGVLMIAFTVPIVVNNFSLYYSHAQTRAKMRPKRRTTKLLNKLAALTMFVPTLGEVQEAADDEKRVNAIKNKPKVVKTNSGDGKSGEDDCKKGDNVSNSSTVDSGMDDKKKKKRVKARKRKGKKCDGENDGQQHQRHNRDSSVETVRSGRPKVIRESELDEVTVLPTLKALHLQSAKNSDDDDSDSTTHRSKRQRAHSFGRGKQEIQPEQNHHQGNALTVPVQRASIGQLHNRVSRRGSVAAFIRREMSNSNRSNLLSPPPLVVVEPSSNDEANE